MTWFTDSITTLWVKFAKNLKRKDLKIAVKEWHEKADDTIQYMRIIKSWKDSKYFLLKQNFIEQILLNDKPVLIKQS